jgi:hypothetical protein
MWATTGLVGGLTSMSASSTVAGSSERSTAELGSLRGSAASSMLSRQTDGLLRYIRPPSDSGGDIGTGGKGRRWMGTLLESAQVLR